MYEDWSTTRIYEDSAITRIYEDTSRTYEDSATSPGFLRTGLQVGDLLDYIVQQKWVHGYCCRSAKEGF